MWKEVGITGVAPDMAGTYTESMANPAPVTPPGGIFNQSGLGADAGPWGVLAVLEDFLLWFAAAVVVAMIIWGGIKYLTAGADAKKADSGKKIVVNAIIGVILVTIVYTTIRIGAGLGALLKSQSSGSTDFQRPQ